MTAREHLEFFATLKGLTPLEREALIPNFLVKLGLSEYADKPCGGYSGGNKRKLCGTCLKATNVSIFLLLSDQFHNNVVGIALIGDPPIVFLDEPSTGMDPRARRSMWDLISSTMAHRSVMLTTHSMEECEALCGRIGIMVAGQLQCLGSAQHLKKRFGNCYQIQLNVSNVEGTTVMPEEPAKQSSVELQQVVAVSERDALSQRVDDFFTSTFGGAALIERHNNSFRYRIDKSRSLADVFR